MRYALLVSLLSLLSGCTLVPIADAGPCSAITNARGCQMKPYYIVKHGTESGGSTQQTGTAR